VKIAPSAVTRDVAAGTDSVSPNLKPEFRDALFSPTLLDSICYAFGMNNRQDASCSPRLPESGCMPDLQLEQRFCRLR